MHGHANNLQNAYAQTQTTSVSASALQAAPLPPPPLMSRIGSLLSELRDHQIEADISLKELSGQLFGYVPESGAQAGEVTSACIGEELVEMLLSMVARARVLRERAAALKSALI